MRRLASKNANSFLSRWVLRRWWAAAGTGAFTGVRTAPDLTGIDDVFTLWGPRAPVTPFRGVHQPPFAQTFSSEEIYLLSYFYDRTIDLGMPESFTLAELQDLAERVCGGEKSWEGVSVSYT